MEIFVFQNQYHVIKEGRVYATFSHESEAIAFQESVGQIGVFKDLTDDEMLRLLTKEELLAGKKQEPIPEEQRQTFEFIRTGA